MTEQPPFQGRHFSIEELDYVDHPTMSMEEIELPLNTFSGYRNFPEQQTTLTQALENTLQKLHEKTAWRHKIYEPTKPIDLIPYIGNLTYGIRAHSQGGIAPPLRGFAGQMWLIPLHTATITAGLYLGLAIENLVR